MSYIMQNRRGNCPGGGNIPGMSRGMSRSQSHGVACTFGVKPKSGPVRPGHTKIALDITAVEFDQFSLYSTGTMTRYDRLSLYPLWLSGNTLASINVVALRQTRLVLRWVTVCGRVNHLGM